MNTAIRCLNYSSTNNGNIEKLYHKDKILQIPDMLRLEIAKFLYKYNNNLLPSSFKSYFTPVNSVHHFITRNSSSNFFLPRKDLDKGLTSLSYRGVKEWSKIPINIKNKNSIYSFTNNYRQVLLESYNK